MSNSRLKINNKLLDKKWIAKGNMDVGFLLTVFLLLAIGLIMLASAGYSLAYYKKEDSYDYIRDQAKYAVIGLIMMYVISRINYNYFRRFVLIGVGGSVVLLLAALVVAKVKESANPGGGEEFGRWISIPGIGQFQPSELAKVGLIAFYAWGCEKYHNLIISKDQQVSIKTAVVFGSVGIMFTLLVFLEHHLSGTILFFLLTIAMLYLGGFNKWWFRILIPVILLVVVVFVINPDFLGIIDEYQQERIIAWKDKSYDPDGARWQINNSLYAIGSGGLLGQGLGESKMKHLYVSESQSDFIFSIVCEELGFIGAAFVLVLYALLIYRGYKIGMKCQSKFGMLLVVGIMVQIGLQTILNVFVVTDFFPNTGISLPFFSAGGTSLIILLCEMGMVLSVSRQTNMIKE